VLFAALVAAGCGSDGAPGKDGADGAKGDKGDNGQDAVVPDLKNDVTGTVTDDAAAPLKGVTVTAAPGGATASTDDTGKFALTKLPVGMYVLTFHLDGYLDQTATVAVNLSGPSKVDVQLATDVSKLVPPALAVTDQLAAGFGTSVSVKVDATGGKGSLTYEWKQTGGPTATITGADQDTITFTTQDFATSIGDRSIANARFGVLGINPDQANNYDFEVTVTDSAGVSAKTSVRVSSTRPSTGLRMVPIGLPIYLQGDGSWPVAPAPASPAPTCTTDADCGGATSGLICTGTTTKTCAAGCYGTGGNACPAYLACSSTTATAGTCNKQIGWNWQLDASGATGSTATISGATSQFPSFIPDKPGTYKVTEASSGKSMTIYAGTWLGEMTDASQTAAGCLTCHNSGSIAVDQFPKWKATAHYSALQQKLDGVSTQYFAEECLSCHTVGYDKYADNGGFDDVAKTVGWTFPAKLQDGNYDALLNTDKLGQLAGIQCESCHGPQNGPMNGPHTSSLPTKTNDTAARISWSSDVCASCHQERPYHYKPAQWDEGGHSNLELAINEGAAEKNANNLPHCGRCHSAQGFARYAKQVEAGYYAFLTSDGKPLSASNHKATASELSAIGMNLAQVESQTCQACHDPHDASKKYQLRAYDTIKALPNGMTNLSAMGSGATCMLCHNSRNAEHSDFAQNTTDVNGNFVSLPYLTSFSGPHSAAQGDFVYGFNLYFMPRYSPSAHLAVGDSCAGCHVKIATDGQTQAGETSNHAFTVDNTICKACHSAEVNGEALQGVNASALDGLRQLIAQKTLKSIKDAVNYVPATGTMGVYARAYDPVSDSYSTASSTITPTTAGVVQIAAGNAPTAVDVGFAKNGTTAMFVLTLPTAVTFQPTAAGAAPVTTNKLMVAFNATSIVTNQKVSGGDATAWPSASTYYGPFSAPGPKTGTVIPAGGPYPAMPNPPPWVDPNAVQVLYKAYWNWSMLNNDATKGIHNPSAFNKAIGATSAALMALP
jgi:predicted CXXCH cytochrome family protein